MTRVSTRTATSSSLQDPTRDCCTSGCATDNIMIPNKLRTSLLIMIKQENMATRTIKYIVPRMHLTQHGHVWNWVATGRGGANAGFGGVYPSSLQPMESRNNTINAYWEGMHWYKNFGNYDKLMIMLILYLY